jgi:hypothetical protein
MKTSVLVPIRGEDRRRILTVVNRQKMEAPRKKTHSPSRVAVPFLYPALYSNVPIFSSAVQSHQSLLSFYQSA